MWRDHSAPVAGGRRRARPAALEAVVDEGPLLVGRVAVRLEPHRVDAILAVAAVGVVRRREAPVAVAGLLLAVEDLALDVERVVDAPAHRRPLLLGHEQRHHQRLEHRPTPARHDVQAGVGVVALEDLDAEVRPRHALGLRLLPRPVAGVREGAPHLVVVRRGHLARGDADVAGDARLRVERAVVVAREVDVLRRVVDRAARRRVNPGAATQQAGVGVVVEAEVHRLVERPRLRGVLGHGVRDHDERGRQPAVVHAGQERVHGAAVRRPDGELRARLRVVPVVELAARLVALQAGHGVQGAVDPCDRVRVRDQPEIARRDRAPEVRADVGGRRVAGPNARRAHVVGDEARLRVQHHVERVPRVRGVAAQRLLRARGGCGARRGE